MASLGGYGPVWELAFSMCSSVLAEDFVRRGRSETEGEEEEKEREILCLSPDHFLHTRVTELTNFHIRHMCMCIEMVLAQN